MGSKKKISRRVVVQAMDFQKPEGPEKLARCHVPCGIPCERFVSASARDHAPWMIECANAYGQWPHRIWPSATRRGS